MKNLILILMTLSLSYSVQANTSKSIQDLKRLSLEATKRIAKKVHGQTSKTKPGELQLFNLDDLKKKSSVNITSLSDGTSDPIQNPDDPVGVPILEPEKPIRYTMGQFTLEKTSTWFNDSEIITNSEVVCEGGIAIPVFDVRGKTDFYLDYSQTLSCTAFIDQRFYRVYISGSIIFNSGEWPFKKSNHVDLKGFVGGFYAVPDIWDYKDGLSFSDYSGAGTLDLDLQQMLVIASRGERSIQLCEGDSITVPIKPREPNDPEEPIRPMLQTKNNSKESSKCEYMSMDGITLTMNLVDQ